MTFVMKLNGSVALVKLLRASSAASTFGTTSALILPLSLASSTRLSGDEGRTNVSISTITASSVTASANLLPRSGGWEILCDVFTSLARMSH